MAHIPLGHDTDWLEKANQFMGSAAFCDIPALFGVSYDSRNLPDVDLDALAEWELSNLNISKIID